MLFELAFGLITLLQSHFNPRPQSTLRLTGGISPDDIIMIACTKVAVNSFLRKNYSEKLNSSSVVLSTVFNSSLPCRCAKSDKKSCLL